MTTDTPIVFVVDDDSRVREALTDLLSANSLRVQAFDSARRFLEFEKPDAPACLVLDLELPDINGLEQQEELASTIAPPIVFITGYGDVPSSVRAMKAGAVEFLSKPFGEGRITPRDRHGNRARQSGAAEALGSSQAAGALRSVDSPGT